MNTNMLIGYFLYKFYRNSKKYYRDYILKEKRRNYNYSMNNYDCISLTTQQYISKKRINKKLQSTPALQPLDLISMISFKKNKVKTNLTATKYINMNSHKPDNYAFTQHITIKAQNLGNTGNTSLVNMNRAGHIKNISKSAVRLIPEKTLPKCSKDNVNYIPAKKVQNLNRFIDTVKDKVKSKQPNYCGLLHFRKWWERTEVDISVNGKFVTGMPIFIEENTLRVINKEYSYFIPLEKVDFIRTTDGLNSCCDS